MKNEAPVAKRKEHYTNYHKNKVIDPYFWLKEKENPEVLEHLKKENLFFEKRTKKYKKDSIKIFSEIKKRIPKADDDVPIIRGRGEFYSRYVKGKQYIQYCKKVGSKIEVLVDFNKMTKAGSYLLVGEIEVSPDGKYLAYSIDRTGDEVCDLVIISTDSKKVISKLKMTSGDFAWSNINILYYTTLDGHLRPDKVWRHILGEKQENDKSIFHEKDKKFFVRVQASSSKKFLIISSGEMVSSYSAYILIDDKNAKPVIFKKLIDNVEYTLDHGIDGFYILTNEKALNFKILKCGENKTAQGNWKLVVGHSFKVHILGFTLSENFLCIFERSRGLPQAHIVDVKTNKDHFVKFPEKAYNMSFRGTTFNFNENKIRINYSSPICPKTIFDYDLKTRKKVLRKKDKINNFRPDKYQVEYVFVNGHDEIKIPLCIVYKKGFKKNGKAPTILYGYGAYGSTIGYNFSSSLVSLLDRGFAYAYAGIRGGADLGRKWYEEGKFLKKKNTFKDFISCSEYLIKKKYTSSEHLAARGGSAGGLLVGAVANMRPDLYKVICAHVPFVDLINTMFDDSLPLTKLEYKEWGNPHEKKYFDYMKTYSPYDNIYECDYPNVYVTAGLNDQRVTYWEPAKWVQKLRDFNSGNNEVLLKINMGGGHFGKSGRFNSLKEIAEEYGYLVSKLK